MAAKVDTTAIVLSFMKHRRYEMPVRHCLVVDEGKRIELMWRRPDGRDHVVCMKVEFYDDPESTGREFAAAASELWDMHATLPGDLQHKVRRAK